MKKIFIISLIAVFLFGAASVFAQNKDENAKKDRQTFSLESLVKAVDVSAKTLTVKVKTASRAGLRSKDIIISTDDNTKFFKNGQEIQLGDVKVYNLIKGRVTKFDGKYIAGRMRINTLRVELQGEVVAINNSVPQTFTVKIRVANKPRDIRDVIKKDKAVIVAVTDNTFIKKGDQQIKLTDLISGNKVKVSGIFEDYKVFAKRVVVKVEEQQNATSSSVSH